MTDIYEYVQREIAAERDAETKAARIVAIVDMLRGYEQDIIFEHEAVYHDDDEQQGNAWLRVVGYSAIFAWLSEYPLGALGVTAWWLTPAVFAGSGLVIIATQVLRAVLAARGAADEEEHEPQADAEREAS